MSWRQRLAELVAVGGALAGCDDSSHQVNFCGNVDPDPCICDRMPADSVQCVAEAQCRASGGQWEFTPGYGSHAPDAATDVWGQCIPAAQPTPDAPAADAAVDVPATDAPGD